MALGIEFTSRPGKTFVAALQNPAANYATLESGIACIEISPSRYRLATSRGGIVWVDAIDGAVRAVGFADLDNPETSGYSDVVAEYPDRQAAGETPSVPLPSGEPDVRAAAADPASISVDGVSVTNRSVAETIAAERHLAAQNAAAKNRNFGIGLRRIVPGSSVGQ